MDLHSRHRLLASCIDTETVTSSSEEGGWKRADEATRWPPILRSSEICAWGGLQGAVPLPATRALPAPR